MPLVIVSSILSHLVLSVTVNVYCISSPVVSDFSTEIPLQLPCCMNTILIKILFFKDSFISCILFLNDNLSERLCKLPDYYQSKLGLQSMIFGFNVLN